MPRCPHWCCTSETLPGRTLCQVHLDYQRARTKAKRVERLLAGCCIQCDDKPVKGQRRCERHKAMAKESRDRRRAALFAARWERQQKRATEG